MAWVAPTGDARHVPSVELCAGDFAQDVKLNKNRWMEPPIMMEFQLGLPNSSLRTDPGAARKLRVRVR
jgi:hypothetical protein